MTMADLHSSAVLKARNCRCCRRLLGIECKVASVLSWYC
jgi:hypothetical protein